MQPAEWLTPLRPTGKREQVTVNDLLEYQLYTIRRYNDLRIRHNGLIQYLEEWQKENNK